ncbi:ribosomal protein S18-alanine N-acetyltransferase [Bombiscardovia coagulans]|uniref:Ribosomal-protein-S18-alanine acetyltransferase n=1 Tax=Bombiscardovia coagulans TaxID=686666 RepID=A0A261ESV4_9BIFI|nr:ribosomal protein S18-alanine N-acetyltransferase [Bombiscardovia coagulans]OZG49940.1 Ribosomal-protein-S18-alanine acetyltransferase [Bombiscardovia coagulans]
MKLRHIEADDIVSLAELEKEVFGADAWTVGMLQQEFNAPARTYLLYEDADGIAAYGGFWYDGQDAELMTIGVSQNFRRQGLARQLLAQLIARAGSQGAKRMLLEVRVDNEPALNLYSSFGFQRLGLRKRYYQPEGIDAYTMAVNIGASDISPESGNESATHMNAVINEQE